MEMWTWLTVEVNITDLYVPHYWHKTWSTVYFELYSRLIWSDISGNMRKRRRMREGGLIPWSGQQCVRLHSWCRPPSGIWGPWCGMGQPGLGEIVHRSHGDNALFCDALVFHVLIINLLSSDWLFLKYCTKIYLHHISLTFTFFYLVTLQVCVQTS